MHQTWILYDLSKLGWSSKWTCSFSRLRPLAFVSQSWVCSGWWRLFCVLWFRDWDSSHVVTPLSPQIFWLIYPGCRVYNGEGNGTPLQYSCLENPMDGGAWWAAVHGVAKSRTRLSDITFTFHFHALKEMATHSSVLAWRVPGMGEPGGLPSMGSHRVGHDWSDLAAVAAASLKVL